MYRLVRKRTAKNESRKTRAWVFFTTTRVFVYSDYILMTCSDLIRRHSSRLSEFSECVRKRKAAIRFFPCSRSCLNLKVNYRLDNSPVVYERPVMYLVLLS